MNAALAYAWRGFSHVRGVVAPVELPAPAPDGETYVTTTLGARLLNVAVCTISSWKAKGYVQPVSGSPARRPLYRWDELVEAEFIARQNAIRTSGSDAQVRRDREVRGRQ